MCHQCLILVVIRTVNYKIGSISMLEMFIDMEKVEVAHIQAQQRAVLHDSQHQDQVMMNLTQIKGTQTKASPYQTIQLDK